MRMIRIKHKLLKENPKLGIPEGGGWFYVLNFRRGVVYSKEYPNRSLLTANLFLKKMYQLDDQRHFFDATNLKGFKEAQKELVNDILGYAFELQTKADLYPEGTYLNFVYQKRSNAIETWVEELSKVKAKHPLEASIRKLKSKLLKLK